MIEIEELKTGDGIRYAQLCTDRKLNVFYYPIGSVFTVKLVYPDDEDDCLNCVEVIDSKGVELDFYRSLRYCEIIRREIMRKKDNELSKGDWNGTRSLP